MLPLPETERLCMLYGETIPDRRTKRIATNMMKKKTIQKKVTPGVAMLSAFISLLNRYEQHDQYFDKNDEIIRELTHSYLPIIVTPDIYKKEKKQLEALVNAKYPCTNVVWITNRQQGKTTTVSKFLAALCCLSPTEGELVCIYAPTQHRSEELLLQMKEYLRKDLGGCKILKDNTEQVTVQTALGYIHSIKARPRAVDSCRGDAPKAAIIDEIGFISPDMWYKFLFPLLPVANRIFTCVTTPPPFGSFFQVFANGVMEDNAKGRYFFRVFRHSLACEDCIKEGWPERCVHRFSYIPPWKGLLRMTQMKQLVPDDKMSDFETEIYGVMNTDKGHYLKSELVDLTWSLDPVQQMLVPPRSPVYIGIDPPSHQKSRVGMCACMMGENGKVVVLGLAGVSMEQCDTDKLLMIVKQFVDNLVAHEFVGRRRPIIPILECNNNSVLCMSIMNMLKLHYFIRNPFVPKYFSKGVCENVGVYTTKENKQMMVLYAQELINENRIFFAKNAVTVDRRQIDGEASKPMTFEEIKKITGQELKAFRFDPRLGISGKGVGGSADDVGMAFLLTPYNAWIIRNTAPELTE